MGAVESNETQKVSLTHAYLIEGFRPQFVEIVGDSNVRVERFFGFATLTLARM